MSLSLVLVVQKLKSLLVHMIETTHPLHAHIRSSFYMNKVFQHLLQWLVVIRMQLQPDIFSMSNTKLWWYGMVLHLHPYGHPPHIKHAKHLLYVWSESGMSMKWMGGPNHILQHVPSEKPQHNPTTVPTPSRVMVWYGVVTLWLPAMVEGF